MVNVQLAVGELVWVKVSWIVTPPPAPPGKVVVDLRVTDPVLGKPMFTVADGVNYSKQAERRTSRPRYHQRGSRSRRGDVTCLTGLEGVMGKPPTFVMLVALLEPAAVPVEVYATVTTTFAKGVLPFRLMV